MRLQTSTIQKDYHVLFSVVDLLHSLWEHKNCSVIQTCEYSLNIYMFNIYPALLLQARTLEIQIITTIILKGIILSLRQALTPICVTLPSPPLN